MFRFERLSHSARFGAVALAVVAGATLAGCGRKGAGDGSDVVARVNGEDVTANQLDAVLGRKRGAAGANDAMDRRALDELINEDIVAQKAVAAKLDKDPAVVAQIEAARREVLVRRFVESAAETVGKPTDDQVRKFYDGHAAVFAQRRVYTIQRTDIQATEDHRADIEAHVKSAKSPAELAAWLKAQNLHATTRQEQDASDQLPPLMNEKLGAMKDGESTVVPAPSGISVVTLVTTTLAPKSFADARPSIEQYLAQSARREVVMNLQKTLRDDAKIEYLGRFAAASAPAASFLPTPASANSASGSTPSSISAASAASGAATAASQNTSATK